MKSFLAGKVKEGKTVDNKGGLKLSVIKCFFFVLIQMILLLLGWTYFSFNFRQQVYFLHVGEKYWTNTLQYFLPYKSFTEGNRLGFNMNGGTSAGLRQLDKLQICISLADVLYWCLKLVIIIFAYVHKQPFTFNSWKLGFWLYFANVQASKGWPVWEQACFVSKTPIARKGAGWGQ